MTDDHVLTLEERAYELPEIWEEAWFSQADSDRMRATAALIPRDARTLVDVGCGNGLFVNELRKDAGRFDRIAAVDRSAAALAHVKAASCRASVDALPFRDGSFDLASSMEVLEHLPDGLFPGALRELGRVTRKYLLVSVPYRENLSAALCTCPSCRARFNPDFHVRSFDEASLSALFDGQGYRQIASQRLGARTTFIDRSIRTRVGSWFQGPPPVPAYAICPECGWHDAAELRRELARRAVAQQPATGRDSGLRVWLERVRPRVTSYHWICALYAR